MSVVNTTYNFNQPNMNFGQALLYGAFGSLTGGMGCFGGGYGMGMGGFGMGGSLFTMPGIGMGGYGFGGFGMGCYSDQMIGMQVGTSIMQYAMFGISRAIKGRGGRGGNDTLTSNIDTVRNNANEHLKVLGNNITLDNFNPSTPAKNYVDKSALDNATDNCTKAERKKNESKAAIVKFGLTVDMSVSDAVAKVLTDEFKANNSNYTEQDLQKYINENRSKKYDEINKLYETYDNDVSNETLAKSTLDQELTKYNEKIDRADNAIEALKPLKEEYDKLIKEQNNESLNKALNKADGNSVSRMRKSDEGKAQTALYDFRKAQEKWNKGDHSGTVKNQLKLAYKNVQDNKKRISSKYESILDSIDSWITQEKLEEIKD